MVCVCVCVWFGIGQLTYKCLFICVVSSLIWLIRQGLSMYLHRAKQQNFFGFKAGNKNSVQRKVWEQQQQQSLHFRFLPTASLHPDF